MARWATTNLSGQLLTSKGDASHFHVLEFACRDGCGLSRVSQDLLDALEKLREVVKEPVHVLSSCRCRAHNTKVGGRKLSRHLPRLENGTVIELSGQQGGGSDAADITVKSLSPAKLFQLSKRRPLNNLFTGRGKYLSFVHLDTRPGPPVEW